MNLHGMQLEAMLVLLGLGALLVDAFRPSIDPRRTRGVLIAGVGAIFLCSLAIQPETGALLGGLVRMDATALFFKRLLLAATTIVLTLALDFRPFGREAGPGFDAVALFAAAGMLLLASANDLVLLFVALELVTISFYVLNSLLRRNLSALEAGTKYLIMGALSAAITVYGIAYMYGATGQTQFDRIRDALATIGPALPAYRFGLTLLLLGLGFKMAMVPMHLWAPDVYQGAPTPTVAFLATGSKVAGFVLLLRIAGAGLLPAERMWPLLLTVAAAVTLVYGTLGAIGQTDVKRLLGYSSIAHAGYLLIGVAAGTVAGLAAVVYYLAQYTFAVLCVFLVVSAVAGDAERTDASMLAGLHRRAPGLAIALFLAVMSLAGVPPLSGAVAKFLVLLAAFRQGASDASGYVLAGIGAAGAVVSLYFYVGLVRAAVIDPAPAATAPVRTSLPVRIAVGCCVAVLVILGIHPMPLMDLATRLFAR